MSGNDGYWIPRTLDDPPLFFIFEADVAMIFLFFAFMGALISVSMFFVGLGLAIVLCRAYSRMKEEGGQGLMLKVLYWYSPSDLWLSKVVPSHVREYVG